MAKRTRRRSRSRKRRQRGGGDEEPAPEVEDSGVLRLIVNLPLVHFLEEKTQKK